MKNAADADLAGTGTRSDRRRRETHNRLLQAAYTLIAEKGIEFLVIQDITNRADVAFGSFYNYFKSKEEIVSAVIELAIEHTADILDRVHSTDKELDETLNVILRLFLDKCQADPLWTAFVARVIMGGRYFEYGFGRRLKRDVMSGIEHGVFSSRDPELSVLAVSGLVMAGIFEILAGLSDPSFTSRLVSQALEILGVDRQRIVTLNAVDLPNIDLPSFLTVGV